MAKEVVEIPMKIICQLILWRGQQDDTWIKFKVILSPSPSPTTETHTFDMCSCRLLPTGSHLWY